MGKKFKTPQEVARDFWATNDIKLYLSEKNTAKYNKEPVVWCSVCKSLHIVNCESPLDRELECYCADCGSIDMVEGYIDEWVEIKNKIN